MIMILPYQYIFIWSLVLSFIVSVVYRIFTKPHEIRQIKKDMKFYREKSKEAQKQKDLKKANEYMSEMMKLSQKQMRQTMKPMFITLGIVLILISFINQTYSGVIVNMQPADEKTSIGHFSYEGFNHSIKADKLNDSEIKVMIDVNDNGNFVAYSKGDIARIGGASWAVTPEGMNVTVMQVAVVTPFAVPIAGWTYLNWLLWYILLSVPFTWIFRKMMGVE